jgi:tetratricopeptide (TPR) repeat protein
MSNFFAKVSPDGKWIVFTQAESFMLLMPDSKLYIMPASGGTPKLMNCNTINMNSWHSWSPNGKWLVFASKRNGPFTQLWLTHIDKDGNDSPPVLLENFSFDERACNIPEFVNIKGGKRFKMHEKFLESDYYGLQIGKSKINQGDFATAVKELTATLKIDPNNYDIYNMRAIAYSELKKYPEAIADFTKCIELKPGSEAYFNRASAKFTQNDFKGALADLNAALNANKKDNKALYKRAIVKYNLEDFKGAVIDFDDLINLDNKNYKAFYERALAKLQLGKIQDACSDLQKAKENGIGEAQELLDKFCR